MSKARPALVGSLLAVVVAIGTVVTPYWVMRPFRPQGAGELQVALVVLRLAPWLLIAAAGVSVWMLARVWSRGWLRRIGASLAVLLVLACGAASRVNLFEQMFAPMQGPEFVAVAQAPLGADEVVMAVRVGGAARGYPVRILAYHHIVTTSSVRCRSSQPIERSATPVWCGRGRCRDSGSRFGWRGSTTRTS